MERLLPRHLQLIYEINDHVLSGLRALPGNGDPFFTDVSMIDESYGRFVRMGHLAFLGARKVNGVSALHGDLMKRTVFRPLHQHFPDRVTAITNGVTPRRWLLECNPGLAQLITECLGSQDWAVKLDRLEELERHIEDPAFRQRFTAIKRDNKARLAAFVSRRQGLAIDPSSLFDVQIKRIHEYKRQLLNALGAVAAYSDVLDGAGDGMAPRVRIFAGKAAPSYWRAKLIIKLINDVAKVVNESPEVRDRLKIVFLPNYNVSLAELTVPAADISEQISTAGMEASGTGNMKFALNGALTIGTLDGANVEIKENVGDDNIFIFGLTTEEVAKRRADGYDPRAVIEASSELSQALTSISSGVFSPDDPQRYRELIDGLYQSDWFMVAADFDSYASTQRDVEKVWRNSPDWYARAIRNVARMGWFSSDRTIRQYAKEIWNVA
jgi:starch phosphorylase